MPGKQIHAKNHFGRIGKDFFKEFESINKERLKVGAKKMSLRTFTNLLLEHDNWGNIREDTIKFKLGDLEDE